jgi:hypothetical protein
MAKIHVFGGLNTALVFITNVFQIDFLWALDASLICIADRGKVDPI